MYGARALNEGGYQSLPEIVFPGQCLLGQIAWSVVRSVNQLSALVSC